MKKIISVQVLQNYRADLTFDDGVSGVVDLSHLVGKGVFEAWRDPVVFEQARVGNGGELVWGDHIDICPDSLYLKITGKTPEEMFPLLRHVPTHA